MFAIDPPIVPLFLTCGSPIPSANEAREAIGKEPVDGFDDPRVPQNIAGSAVNPEEGGRPPESSPIEEE